MRDLEKLRGPDLAMLLKRRESSLRGATAKGTLSRRSLSVGGIVTRDASQQSQHETNPSPETGPK